MHRAQWEKQVVHVVNSQLKIMFYRFWDERTYDMMLDNLTHDHNDGSTSRHGTLPSVCCMPLTIIFLSWAFQAYDETPLSMKFRSTVSETSTDALSDRTIVSFFRSHWKSTWSSMYSCLASRTSLSHFVLYSSQLVRCILTHRKFFLNDPLFAETLYSAVVFDPCVMRYGVFKARSSYWCKSENESIGFLS